MAEPVSSTATGYALVAVTGLALYPGQDAAVILGAFAGAAVYVLSSDGLSLFKSAGFFLVSFFSGYLGAGSVAALLMRWPSVEISPGVCALLVAACAVNLLQGLNKKLADPVAAWRSLKGGGQ
ncbi:Putative phage holin [Chromobacterium vaccinii]|nr:Putative phage holin [Chromobacterium vaccinii]QND91729.1 Putative phage holin [Chromobacterium vaccinii]